MFSKIMLVFFVVLYIFSVAVGVVFALCEDYFVAFLSLGNAISASFNAGTALCDIRIERLPNEKH